MWRRPHHSSGRCRGLISVALRPDDGADSAPATAEIPEGVSIRPRAYRFSVKTFQVAGFHAYFMTWITASLFSGLRRKDMYA